MSAPNDGGPAFPDNSLEHPSDQRGGMSLRDWLAGRCPLTLEQSAQVYGMPLDEILRGIDHTAAFFAVDAELRHDWADAMLAARKETTP